MRQGKITRVRRTHRKERAKKLIRGTLERPRLSVFRSNKALYAQIIDDTKGKTLVSASSRDVKDAKTKTSQAKAVGVLIAQRAKEAGISKVVFHRSHYQYHGRVKALAEGAREGGLVM